MTVSVIRTIILYLVLTFSMRIMGKRQLGELQPNELVVTLLLSDLAAVPMQENGLPLFNGVLPILTLVAIEVTASALMLKWPALSRLISGSPMPIIKDGKVDQRVMKRLRLTIDDLMESLRQQDIFDIRQVQYAIAETNGHISAYCYSKYQNATAGDVKGSVKDTGMPVVVVSDGRCSDWGLALCDLDEKWLHRQLEKHRCSLEQVFLLTATKTGDCFLLTRQDIKGGKA